VKIRGDVVPIVILGAETRSWPTSRDPAKGKAPVVPEPELIWEIGTSGTTTILEYIQEPAATEAKEAVAVTSAGEPANG
jgi:hypothetical protein